MSLVDTVRRGHRCKSVLYAVLVTDSSTRTPSGQPCSSRLSIPSLEAKLRKAYLPEPSCDVVKLGETIITNQLDVAKPQRT